MKRNSFVEGTFIATAAVVLVKILGMLYVIPFYHIVGSQGGALYSYAYNIYNIFLSMSSAGLPSAVSKIISEYDTLGYHDAKNRAISIAYKLIGILSIVVFLVLFVFADEIGMLIIHNIEGGNTYQDIAFVVRCVAPAVLVIPFLSVTKGYLQGHKYMSPSSVSQLIEQIVRIVVILLGSYLVLNVFHGTLSLAVGIAVSGAFVGGLAAVIYLRFMIRKHGDELFGKSDKKDLISNKEILKKIVGYALPFVIIAVVNDLYSFTDQYLVLHTINKMGYSTSDVEFIASSVSTWAPKICMIINALAIGMMSPLIPAISSAVARKDNDEVEAKINKAISLVVYVSLPLALGINILAEPIWGLFYNYNVYGPYILRVIAFSAVLGNVYLVLSTSLQSLSKYKLVYVISILGFVLNGLLDVPIMWLCHFIGIEGFIGSTISSYIGYSVSIIIGLYYLHKDNHISFKYTMSILSRSLIPGALMTTVLLIFNHFAAFNYQSTIGSIVMIIVNMVIGAPIFLYVSYKMGILQDVFGMNNLKKIVRKLTFNKVKLGD